jgi:hypothetical protein
LGLGISFKNEENVLKLIVLMIAQHCEYTKSHQSMHIKWVDCEPCELYFKKAIPLKNCGMGKRKGKI